MPEGHTLHRLARDLRDRFAGRAVAVSSPQGRFAEGAALLDGTAVVDARAWGKHLFVEFTSARVLHVHLGLYGKFLVSVGTPGAAVGQVRLRLVAAGPEPAYADLRGATACELLTREQEAALLARLGPDPLQPGADPAPAWERVRRSRSPLGGLLMDQAVLAGIGNVYRAEVLFRHRLHPLRPGSTLRRAQFRSLWDDLVALLQEGVRTGRIDTVGVPAPVATRGRLEPATPGGSRVWVYRREGEACFVCGVPVRGGVLAGRNLFWCPRCQPAPRTGSAAA